jgi:type IV secretory pathway VirD2 relaxase
MPAGTDAAAVKDAARAFAIETFGHNHDYVFVQHLEDKHPHVHLTVRSLGHDGKRLNPRKADLQVWRERFAGELRLRGIAAEATPRRTRGKVRKADRGTMLALRKRAITPYVDRRAREEVLWEAQNGTSGERLWERQIQARQEEIRRSYLNCAAELERTGQAPDQALAREIREFVRDMPSIETRCQLLKKELGEFAESRRRDAARDTESPRRSESEKHERGK